jgi:hypothetical protein
LRDERNQHVTVDQVIRNDVLHRLAGQHDRHPIPESRQADRPALIHRPPHACTAQVRTLGREALEDFVEVAETLKALS